MSISSYLVVEQGAPFESGAYISLTEQTIILGRRVPNWTPDIVFDNIFISRKHLKIFSKNQTYYIKDLGSKHGTKVNDEPLPAHQDVMLRDGDTITLSSNCITLKFNTSIKEHTSDFIPLQAPSSPEEQVSLDSNKQSIIVEGESYVFSEKEYQCLELLTHHVDQFVSLEEIKRYVWHERIYEEDQIPDVSSEEVNTLIYRIRKKTPSHFKIENLRGKGYILSV